MEQSRTTSFAPWKEKNTILSRLELFYVMTDALLNETEESTVSIMKTLAYLTPLPGLSYLNNMFDTLIDIIFHLHMTMGKSTKLVSLDFPDSKEKIVTKEFRKKINCLSYLLGLSTEEQEGEHPSVYAQRIRLTDGLLRNIVTICLEKLIKIARVSGAPSDLVDTIKRIKPRSVVRQIMLGADDAPKPKKLVSSHPKGSAVIKGVLHIFFNRQRNRPNHNNNAHEETGAHLSKEMYLKAEVKYKTKLASELSLSEGQTVKQKLLSSDSSWAFGWKKSFITSKKEWGFFPTRIASKRVDEGSESLPLLY